MSELMTVGPSANNASCTKTFLHPEVSVFLNTISLYEYGRVPIGYNTANGPFMDLFVAAAGDIGGHSYPVTIAQNGHNLGS